ncbi:MAG: histidine kinase [Clostridia bacterium]|nr:histidine kinase [Clostridia bacterium]
MKLSVKMILIFSMMMLVSLLLLSSYAASVTVTGANEFTEARFRNMSASIENALQREVSLMEMTLRELSDNTTYTAALNQMVRDDSEEQKMALAAGKTAINQMQQSPLVDSFYRVSFYTREGVFLTTYVDAADRDYKLEPGTEEAKAAIAGLGWLDEADETGDFVLLSLHDDILSSSRSVRVYGIGMRLAYHGKPIGYLEVANLDERASRILNYLDEDSVILEMIFDDGDRLYESGEVNWAWPDTLTQDALTTVETGNSSRKVYYSHINSLGLRLYISQDDAVTRQNNAYLRQSMFLRALYILLPVMALILFVSLGLTRSINKLTKKMRQLPADSVLRQDKEATQSLLSTVTKPNDRETYELEQGFNKLILRLRDSAANELSLREGTLQAQLSALQTQINPHFIYNTLNIISAKAMESGNYDVIEICDQFAQMLRYSTDTRSKTATMAEEIENTRNYLLLAKARYEDNLEFTIDVPENLSDITVPKLTLQPLVENALNHGFDGTNTLRKLSVTGKIQDRQLILEIRDNGTGFSDEMLRSLRERIREIEDGKVSIAVAGGHIGLVNTCLRLHYYSQGRMHVSIRNENGAVVTIAMPAKE